MRCRNLSEYSGYSAKLFARDTCEVEIWSMFDNEYSACIKLLSDAYLAYSLSELKQALAFLKVFKSIKTTHFLQEEMIMLDLKYEGYSEHRAEHVNFTSDLSRYIIMAERLDTNIGDLLSYVTSWVNGHIFVYDQRLDRHLNGSHANLVVSS